MMHTILGVNAGSSSVRLERFTCQGPSCHSVQKWHGQALDNPQAALNTFLGQGAEIACVVHRVVHGGNTLVRPSRVTAEVRAEIARWAPMAPLHNPAALHWMEVCAQTLGPQVAQYAAFDTGLFAPLPDVAKTYALPHALCEKHALRRYGFHGLAHEAMWSHFCGQRADLAQGGRLITLQLGSGCSVAALKNGAPVDTSMGFSPLEGLMMGTRCGDVDAGLLLHLQRVEGLSTDTLENLLTHESGLLGVSGVDSDMRRVCADTSARAQRAVQTFCYRVAKYVAAYMVPLQGLDGIVFGGGIGENMPSVRAQIMQHLQWLGCQLDDAANADTIETARRISIGPTPDIWVIPVNEAELMVQKVVQLRHSNRPKE